MHLYTLLNGLKQLFIKYKTSNISITNQQTDPGPDAGPVSQHLFKSLSKMNPFKKAKGVPSTAPSEVGDDLDSQISDDFSDDKELRKRGSYERSDMFLKSSSPSNGPDRMSMFKMREQGYMVVSRGMNCLINFSLLSKNKIVLSLIYSLFLFTLR